MPRIYAYWNERQQAYSVRVRERLVAHGLSFILLGAEAAISRKQQANAKERRCFVPHAFIQAKAIIFFPNRKDSLNIIPAAFDRFVAGRKNCMLQWIPACVNTEEIERYYPYITNGRGVLNYHYLFDNDFYIRMGELVRPLDTYDTFDLYCGVRNERGKHVPVMEVIRLYTAKTAYEKACHAKHQLQTIRAFGNDNAARMRNADILYKFAGISFARFASTNGPGLSAEQIERRKKGLPSKYNTRVRNQHYVLE